VPTINRLIYIKTEQYKFGVVYPNQRFIVWACVDSDIGCQVSICPFPNREQWQWIAAEIEPVTGFTQIDTRYTTPVNGEEVDLHEYFAEETA